MTLTALAQLSDLDDRNITVPDGVDGDIVLQSASDAVRDAAGCAITQLTSTATFVVNDYRRIDIPGPVQAVISVVVNSVPVTGWSKLGDTIVMPCGWTQCLPVEVTITWQHGYPVIPSDIVDLVCSMASMAFGQDGDYGSGGLRASVRLGEYGESFFNAPGTDSPSPVSLPDSVRQRLRARFGSSMGVISQR